VIFGFRMDGVHPYIRAGTSPAPTNPDQADDLLPFRGGASFRSYLLLTPGYLSPWSKAPQDLQYLSLGAGGIAPQTLHLTMDGFFFVKAIMLPMNINPEPKSCNEEHAIPVAPPARNSPRDQLAGPAMMKLKMQLNATSIKPMTMSSLKDFISLFIWQILIHS
jgi:hypothetical protein